MTAHDQPAASGPDDQPHAAEDTHNTVSASSVSGVVIQAHTVHGGIHLRPRPVVITAMVGLVIVVVSVLTISGHLEDVIRYLSPPTASDPKAGCEEARAALSANTQGKSSPDRYVQAEVRREEAASLDAAADKATNPALRAALRTLSTNDRDDANAEVTAARAWSESDAATAARNWAAAAAATKRGVEADTEWVAARQKALDNSHIVGQACGWS